MQEVFEKIKQKLEELRKAELDREDYIDANGRYNDCEEAFEDGESRGRYEAYTKTLNFVDQVAEEYGKDTNVRSNNDWIPCSVVLHPEHMHDCEVTVQDSFGLRREIAFFTDKWRRTSDEVQLNVIAWKEPSQPYKY